MTSVFLMFLALMVGIVATVLIRFLPQRTARIALLGLTLWLVYAGTLGYLGIVGNPSLRPPGPAFLLLPVFLFVALFLVRSNTALRVATSIPIGLLMGLQTFRIIVELFLHQLWKDGLAPRMLTYEGANFDMLIGISAPIVGWLYANGKIGERLALGWNVLGLTMLANVALRAILTAPGVNAIPSDIPNLAIGTFPFTFIPGFMAPLALVLHVITIRALRAKQRVQNRVASSVNT
jgi:hypothetical protein